MSINPKLKLFKIGTYNQQQQQQTEPQQQQEPPSNDSKKLKNHKSKLSIRSTHNKTEQFEATSSILSDYDDLEIIDSFDDDQSSYVLFNPKLNNNSSTRNESDILSLTNTSKEEKEVGQIEEQEEEEDDEDTEQEDNDAFEEEEDEIMESHKNKRHSENYDKLSNKINSWHNSNIYSSSQPIDENIASWNLDYDEEDQQQSQSQSQFQSQSNLNQSKQSNLSNSNQSLEESKKLLKEFYGDDLFKYLKDDDILKVKNYLKSLDIKTSLTTNNNIDEFKNKTLIQQIIYKILYSTNQSTELETSTTTLNKNNKYLMGSTDYINYLTKDIQHYDIHHQYYNNHHTNTFSEISGGGSSSMIPCGGIGFGNNTSWNEI
ncbi:uncharacterized protein KGF55_004694 [Candida pseudojiufengensis]|uniref:uncharacterized protein n=1 Tax=Candida pseudojiufengensis TaxID=497109 RepID=UPI00222591CD|nr:uncharacterized protein KGF55_004694 [Candida pseudojiufengensis]KAI5960402.1 hypothetical protein KGF55_004694 [Candida pseudojiufengensis]